MKSRNITLRGRVTGWLGGILLLALLALGSAAAMGRWTSSTIEGLLRDNDACYTVHNALKAESRAFVRYMRDPTPDTAQEYRRSCQQAAQSIQALPFVYDQIGQERYARTWNLRQGYAGYCLYRDALAQQDPGQETDLAGMYQVMEMQDALLMAALRLTQATLQQQSAAYARQRQLLASLPWLYLALCGAAVGWMLVLLRMLSATVVAPLLRLSQAAQRIAVQDLSGPELPVESGDEVGQLVGTFNQMKQAMAQQLSTLQALHRQQLHSLALEKDLEHTRLEMLKSQVNPHFLFNTLHTISCMARLEEAPATDEMILRLSGLFRHNLRTKRQQVSLEEELAALADYVYLQQVRFEGRITYQQDLQVDPAAVQLPSFTLQPVVENAYAHGLRSREEGGRILLRAWMQGDTLLLTVADNGCGMDPQALAALEQRLHTSAQTGQGIGLGHIFCRIGMLYPGGSMKIYSRAGCGTVIRFAIPQKDNTIKEDAEHEV